MAPEATPTFTRKQLGRHHVWADELEIARAFAAERGLTLALSNADYQVAKLTGSDVRLVIYPHTVKSTRNQHLRVRDEGSKNKERAHALMVLLNHAAGYNCTFSFRRTATPRAWAWTLSIHDPGRLAEIERAASGAEQ